LIKRIKDKRLSDGPSDFVVGTGNLTWDEHMAIVNANTGLGQTLTLSGEGLKKLNQKLLEARKKKTKKNKSSSSQAGGPAHKESGFKRPG